MLKLYLIFLSSALVCAQITKADSVCSVIDQPGNYEYGADNIVSPSDPDDAIVCITSSNVVVDLGEHVFAQTPGNTVGGLNGVVISADLKNVTLRNGNIGNVTGAGIIVNEGCENIVIENIQIRECPAGGILLAGTSLNAIKDGSIIDCLVLSCTGNNGGPAYGMRLVECDNFVLKNCVFENNDAGTIASGFGLSLENCDSCKIVDCSAQNNGGNILGVGISLFQCRWAIVRNCNSMNTIARSASGTSKAVGFLINDCDHNTLTDCIVKHSNSSLSQSYGFELLDGSDNMCVLCNSRNNSGATVAAGFAINGTESQTALMECTSRINNGGVAGTGYGIYINGPQNCDIWQNKLIGNTGLIGVGLKDTTTDTTNLIAGNLSFQNTTTAFDVNRTSGSLPVLFATVGDFSTIASASDYENIAFT
ncbi:MAG: hypothetical protein BWY54_00880 [Candidatus Dependentiae bacterium ADurb.Bin331]|nr:MAG: hypothetical protein BWY54_00880 [Candidatus Dependentiae bacterium ADurb.Bin331]